jgi:hypothetical protein
MAPLHDALKSLHFSNSDVMRATHNVSMRAVSSIYLETEAPLKARWAWADGRITPFHTHSYLFVENATANQTTGGTGQGVPGWGVPPAGMRSSPPLGGLATGTVELRADGSLQAWTIENASPAGSAKMSRLDLAVLGVRFPSSFDPGAPHRSLMLRTHPPAVQGVTAADGIGAMSFSGAQPYTRLTPLDPSIPDGLNLELFGRSRWRLGNMTRSHTPAVGFTLTASNPAAHAVNVTLFLSLPMGLQHGVQRCDQGQGPECFLHTQPPSFSTPDAAACLAACTANQTCTSWNFNGDARVWDVDPSPRAQRHAARPDACAWPPLRLRQGRGNCTLNAHVPPAYNGWDYDHMEVAPGDERTSPSVAHHPSFTIRCSPSVALRSPSVAHHPLLTIRGPALTIRGSTAPLVRRTPCLAGRRRCLWRERFVEHVQKRPLPHTQSAGHSRAGWQRVAVRRFRRRHDARGAVVLRSA